MSRQRTEEAPSHFDEEFTHYYSKDKPVSDTPITFILKNMLDLAIALGALLL